MIYTSSTMKAGTYSWHNSCAEYSIFMQLSATQSGPNFIQRRRIISIYDLKKMKIKLKLISLCCLHLTGNFTEKWTCPPSEVNEPVDIVSQCSHGAVMQTHQTQLSESFQDALQTDVISI